MTDKLWSSMTDRERDAALAEAIGWDDITYWQDGAVSGRHETNGGQLLEIPTFTTSLDAVRLVEGVIEERNLGFEYVRALCSVCKVSIEPQQYYHEGEGAYENTISDYVEDDGVFRLLRATPAQRAEAAYKILVKDPS